MGDSKPLYTKIIITAFTLIALAALLFGLWIKWELWEPEGIKRGTLVYWLKIPAELKNFQTWGVLTAPEYDISLPDSSVGPSAARMKYTTSLSLHEVLAEVKKLQFGCKQYTPDRAVCKKVISLSRSIKLFYGKILHNRVENIEVVYLVSE